MPKYRKLYEQRDFPIFQNRMYETAESARNCQRGDIRIVQDSSTGLIFNSSFNPELMIYDVAYQNEQAISPSFRKHLDQVATIVVDNLGTHDLIEIGCGKGFFLELLIERGCSITGFDPAYEGNNSAIKKDLFESTLSFKSKGIILRHVLEHIQNPLDFLQQVLDINGGGLIYIEVPCFEWIIQKRAWFDIYYEHVNYFRLRDFNKIFSKVHLAGHLFGGQYLFVVADLASLRLPSAKPSDAIAFPHGFTLTGLSDFTGNGRSEAIWGAASKGVIYALLRDRCGHPVNFLIDINPAKIGKFIPGTGLRVLNPKNALLQLTKESVIYVMNPNYIDEIRQATGMRFRLITFESDQ